MKIIRLADAKAGFGRRRSFAPGHSHTIGISRKAAHPELVAARVPGTTVSASDLVSRKTKERLALVQAGRVQSLPSRVRASSKKAAPPHERVPMDEDQAASAAAVFQSMTSIKQEQLSKSGPPGAPGKTFDELFEWNVDDDGVPFHEKGSGDFRELPINSILGSD